MNHSHRHVVVLALLLSFAVLAGPGVLPSQAADKHFVCGPCGQPCDSRVFDKPGSCPECGMALVEQGTGPVAPDTRKKVGILIFNGVQIIDYTGPYELFGAADFNVYTVAETRDPVTTALGMTVVPHYTFADAPPPDVLVVPGGGVRAAMDDSLLLHYVTSATAQARHTMSVCNGSFILASAGLLDGLEATTTYGNVMTLHTRFPKVKVIGNRRYVDSGKIITTAGLSAGMDGALHVIALMNGEQDAVQTALMEEYDWRPTGGYVRPALADRMIPNIDITTIEASLGKWKILSSTGDSRQWQVVAQGAAKADGKVVLQQVGALLESRAGWTRAVGSEPAATAGPSETARWTFADVEGKPWTGSLEVRPRAKSRGEFEAILAIHHGE